MFCRTLVSTIATLTFLLTAAGVSNAQEKAKPERPKIDWRHGPATGFLGTQAKIEIPKGYIFTTAEGAKKFLELTQNIPHGNELGIFGPDNLKWFVVFQFDETGYVKDDEKASLDADAMLKSIQQGTERANEERRKRGWDTISVTGWIQPPHYDENTHNLEWSTDAKDSNGARYANHNTRYLGRRGVMKVGLVADSDALSSNLVTFRGTMNGFSYSQDNRYTSFVKGDKVAEYGLTALVVGGAAAAAAKAGLFKSLWKILLGLWKVIAVGFVALGGFIKRLFTGRKAVPQQSAQ